MPENPLALLILGLAAGLMSGMFGIGGGAIIVPALTVLFAFELKEALGTSLAVLVWPVSVFAVLAYYRARLIQIVPAMLVSAGLIAGGVVGAQLALSLPSDTLQRLYGIFLIYVGWRFIEPRKLLAAANNNTPPVEPAPQEMRTVEWYWMLGVGLLAGVASGLFGIGGGLVIVPALVELLHYDQKRAVGTSLAALLPPVGIGAVISYYDAGEIHLGASAFIALGLIAGAFFGARIALGLPSKTVKRLYGVFLVLVSLRFIFGL